MSTWITTHTFVCVTCGSKEEMNTEQAKKHLAEKHGITEPKGKMKAIAFMDGSGFYQQVFEWKQGKVEMTKTVRGEKQKS